MSPPSQDNQKCPNPNCKCQNCTCGKEAGACTCPSCGTTGCCNQGGSCTSGTCPPKQSCAGGHCNNSEHHSSGQHCEHHHSQASTTTEQCKSVPTEHYARGSKHKNEQKFPHEAHHHKDPVIQRNRPTQGGNDSSGW